MVFRSSKIDVLLGLFVHVMKVVIVYYGLLIHKVLVGGSRLIVARLLVFSLVLSFELKFSWECEENNN